MKFINHLFLKVLVWLLVLFLLPVYLVLSMLIIIYSGFPVIFRQKRVGLNGKVFTMYKFRTMHNGAEKEQESLKSLNEADGPVFKIRNDPRFTRIGRFLNHSGLDELPQFINVLKGDMGLVGPRPLPVNEENKIDKKYQLVRRSVSPGIISLWVIEGHHKMSFEEWMKCDLRYIEKKTYFYDYQLMIRGGLMLLRLVVSELLKI